MTDGEATDGQRQWDKRTDRNRCQTNTNGQTEAGGQGDRLMDGLPEGQKKTHCRVGLGPGGPHKESERPRERTGARRGRPQVGRGGAAARTPTPGSGPQSPQDPRGAPAQGPPLPPPPPRARPNPSPVVTRAPDTSCPRRTRVRDGGGETKGRGDQRGEVAGCGPRKTSLQEGKRRNYLEEEDGTKVWGRRKELATRGRGGQDSRS